MIEIKSIKLDIQFKPEEENARLRAKAAKYLRIKPVDIQDLVIVKKSVDARRKDQIFLVYTIKLKLSPEHEKFTLKQQIKDVIAVDETQNEHLEFTNEASINNQNRPAIVVIGSGPAGMFAALALAEAGLKPIILERGQEVDQRLQEVSRFWREGKLNPESNVQFGEGGAGTFSDGKLTTGINDPYCKQVLNTFVAAGAPSEIAYLSKPHIGTDRLRQAIKNIRRRIIDLGGEYRFGHQLTEIIIEDQQIKGIKVSHDQHIYEMEAEHLILAIGHSARDTFAMLAAAQVPMQAKAFSIGVRIEHPQSLIDFSQYGSAAGNPLLGAADYKLACHLPNGRSVYTFCMCPGGTVVAAASEVGGVVTNGMSNYDRSGRNANSALLVGITPKDFLGEGPLAGIEYQRMFEQQAYQLAGQTYAAPAQLVKDFLQDKASSQLGAWQATYLPGVIPTDLSQCLPDFVVTSLRAALPILDKKLKGFAHDEAIMIGVETRSSSPVRILRGTDFQSELHGIYPCGEGAGYAGGIMSAATDGLHCAEALLKNIRR